MKLCVLVKHGPLPGLHYVFAFGLQISLLLNHFFLSLCHIRIKYSHLERKPLKIFYKWANYQGNSCNSSLSRKTEEPQLASSECGFVRVTSVQLGELPIVSLRKGFLKHVSSLQVVQYSKDVKDHYTRGQPTVLKSKLAFVFCLLLTL